MQWGGSQGAGGKVLGLKVLKGTRRKRNQIKVKCCSSPSDFGFKQQRRAASTSSVIPEHSGKHRALLFFLAIPGKFTDFAPPPESLQNTTSHLTNIDTEVQDCHLRLQQPHTAALPCWEYPSCPNPGLFPSSQPSGQRFYPRFADKDMKQEADWSRSMRRSQKPRSGSLSDSPELISLLEELGFVFIFYLKTETAEVQLCFLFKPAFS